MSFELKGYEKDDMSMKSIALYTFLGIVAILFSVLFVSLYFDFEKENYYKKNVMQVESEYPKEYKKSQAQFLDSYNVIDKENGLYSIPIDKAMQIVEKKYSGNSN